MPSQLPPTQLKFLADAAAYLERPKFLMKIADLVGRPVDFATQKLPPAVAKAGQAALTRAMSLASSTVSSRDGTESTFEDALQKSGWEGFWHTLASMVPAALGGPFGLAGLAVELPITTGIMFRSIASTATTFGENPHDPAVRLECLTVFSQGGPSPDDDAMESSYLTMRLSLAAMIREAADFVAKHTAKQIAEACIPAPTSESRNGSERYAQSDR